jgi:hypothetical protein
MRLSKVPPPLPTALGLDASARGLSAALQVRESAPTLGQLQLGRWLSFSPSSLRSHWSTRASLHLSGRPNPVLRPLQPSAVFALTQHHLLADLIDAIACPLAAVPRLDELRPLPAHDRRRRRAARCRAGLETAPAPVSSSGQRQPQIYGLASLGLEVGGFSDLLYGVLLLNAALGLVGFLRLTWSRPQVPRSGGARRRRSWRCRRWCWRAASTATIAGGDTAVPHCHGPSLTAIR